MRQGHIINGYTDLYRAIPPGGGGKELLYGTDVDARRKF